LLCVFRITRAVDWVELEGIGGRNAWKEQVSWSAHEGNRNAALPI